MIKKIFSIFFCAVLTTPTVAFAQNSMEYELSTQLPTEVVQRLEASSFSRSQQEDIKKELVEMQENLFITPNQIEDISIDEDGNYCYTVEIGTSKVETEITLLDVENGYGCIAVEGNKREEIVITDDDRVFLNGNEITVTYGDAEVMGLEEIDHKLYRNGEEVETREITVDEISEPVLYGGNIDHYFTSICPSGTTMNGYPINYDSFQLREGVEVVNNVEFQQDLEDISLYLFITTFLVYFTPYAGLTAGQSIAVDSFIEILDTWYFDAIENDPRTEQVSYTDFVYVHYDGSQLTLTKSAWQHSLYGYSEKNCEGDSVHITFYEIKEYDF